MPDTAGYAASSLGEDSSKLRRQREVYKIRNPAQPSPLDPNPRSQPAWAAHISRERPTKPKKKRKKLKKKVKEWSYFWGPKIRLKNGTDFCPLLTFQ